MKRNRSHSSDDGDDFTKRQRTVEVEHSATTYVKELLTTGIFHDIIVQTKHNNYSLHRNLLCRSPYFKQLLLGDWNDSSESKLDLSIVEEAIPGSSEHWDALFTYMYCDEIQYSQFNFEEISIFNELVKFFGLPQVIHGYIHSDDATDTGRSIVQKMDLEYRFGGITDSSDESDNEVLLTFISEVNDAMTGYTCNEHRRESIMKDLAGVSDSFLNNVFIRIKFLPLSTIVFVLHLWMKQNLNIDTMKDLEWRYLEKAQSCKQIIDSIELHVLEDISKYKQYNLFSDQIFNEALEWSKSDQMDFSATTIFYAEPCGYDAEDGLDETTTIGSHIRLKVTAGESSSAYWWNISPSNELTVPIKLTLHAFASVEGAWQNVVLQLDPYESHEDAFVFYGEQCNMSACYAKYIATIEKGE